PEAEGLRVDVMSRMRGVDPFPGIWQRRTVMELPDGTKCDLLSLPDLVQAKKTQRDKDWPMIRRLVEAHYFENRDRATVAQVKFWLRELRTPELLIEVAQSNPVICRRLTRTRPLLGHAAVGKLAKVESALLAEERAMREKDRRYWAPLREELQQIRRNRRRDLLRDLKTSGCA